MQRQFYQTLAILTVLVGLQIQVSYAQNGFFQPLNDRGARMGLPTQRNINQFDLYRIDVENLRVYLQNAPLEFKQKGQVGKTLEVPLPNGTMETFRLFESPTLSPAVAERHPEIKTYMGKGTMHPEYYLTVNLTSSGFNAIVLGVEGDAVYFDHAEGPSDQPVYRTYFTRDAVSPDILKQKSSNSRCATPNSRPLLPSQEASSLRSMPAEPVNTTGATLRTFRLAMAANAEFVSNKGGTQALAFDALVGYVTRMRAVFRKELSVDLNLVSDINQVYTTPGTPYTNSSQSTMLTENQTNLDAIFTNSGYDVGHVLGYEGSSGGGLADLGVVCVDGYKGEGTSGVGDGSFAPVFDDQLIMHEVGHMFGMTHSYNSTVPVCTTREQTTSVEPGSGTTIMSYGYTCYSDSDPNISDDYESGIYQPILNFHTVSYSQANALIASTATCYTATDTYNAEPVISSMPMAITIPKSTPFVLTGTATDADEVDVLTYSWEGTNTGTVSAPDETTLANTALPPFFRSYEPSTSGTRYFPRLEAILNGSNYAKGDKLPSVGVTTTHRLSVRDGDSGVTFGEVEVTVDGNSGPFVVHNDLSGSFHALSTQTITWEVNNTDMAPINCTLVDIFLSTDGGQTFPTLLLTTANTGSADVTLPEGETSTARIKIAPSTLSTLSAGASGRAMMNTPNIFFDISNVDFTITAPLPVTLVRFDAKLQGENSAKLSWTTTQEKNNAGFDIEMSPDARTFLKVGYVDGHGDSQVEAVYDYLVSDLASGVYYFRLKQLDLNGQFEYSTVRALEVTNRDQLASVFPNPSHGKLTFKAEKYKGQPCSVLMVDQNGSIVKSLPMSTEYTTGAEIDVTGLPTGVYNIIVQGAGFLEKLKFVKL